MVLTIKFHNKFRGKARLMSFNREHPPWFASAIQKPKTPRSRE